MAVDWAWAWRVGGIGFGLVFAVLAILALAMWLTGRVLGKISGGTGSGEEKEGS